MVAPVSSSGRLTRGSADHRRGRPPEDNRDKLPPGRLLVELGLPVGLCMVQMKCAE